MSSVNNGVYDDLENRARKSFDQKFFKKQLQSVGIYRLKKSDYFSYFIQNPRIELSPNKYFNYSWYAMQNPETRNSDLHPYLSYLATGYKENRLPNEYISLEEARTLRINTTYSPVEILQERNESEIHEFLVSNLWRRLGNIVSFLEILWNSRGNSFQRKKTVWKIFLSAKPGKTYRSAYENYSRICCVIGNSGTLKTVLKTDAHNESGRYSISIPLTPLISRFAKKIYCLELDENVIADAKQFTITPLNVELTQGSITAIPFGEGEFDCILDFSTIDHLSLEEADLALKEYLRVSTVDSLIVIVVWTSHKYSFDEPNLQTYFSRLDFGRNLKAYFNVYFEKSLLNVEQGKLVLFVCSKRSIRRKDSEDV